MAKRIVITGMGIVSPLGVGVDKVWSRLLAGHSGIRKLPEQLLRDDIPVRIGGTIPDIASDPEAGFDAEHYVSAKEQRRMDRFIVVALAAAEEALRQANWTPQTEEEKQRTATIVASGIGGIHTITDTVRILDNQNARKLSPFTVPAFLANLASGQISIKYGFQGPLGAPVTACAAGVQAIGDAMRIIVNDEADIALCGGSDACINEVSLGGFTAARAMSTGFNDTPEQASRPFDRQRDGFVISEGAGLMVIETLEHAQARGATPIAELVGYGTSADAYHVTAGPSDGSGALQSMRSALRWGGIAAEQIHYINAHATSTPVGDKGELAAIKALFGTSNRVAVSSTKSSTGHLLGAAGGVASIFAALSLKNQIAPVNLNCSNPDEDAEGIDIVMDKARPMAMEYALCNGFGFGGVNATLLLKHWQS